MSHDPTLCRRCQRPLENTRGRRVLLLGGLGAVALVGLGVTAAARSDRYDAWDTRAKGDFDLQVYAWRGGRPGPLNRYDRVVHPGERVRFVLTGVPDEHPYVLVGSVDGAGGANIYFPYAGDRSGTLSGPGRWEIPGSIVLDETLGYERVYVVFSRAPLTVAVARAALERVARQGKNAVRDQATIELAGTVQRSFLIFKQP